MLAGAFWLWKHYDARLKQEIQLRQTAEEAAETANLRAREAESEKERLLQDLLEQQKQQPPPQKTTGKKPGQEPVAAVPDLPEYLDLADAELVAYAATFDENVRGTKSTDTPEANPITGANTAISNKQFQLAASLLEKTGKNDPLYPTALEMLAYVYAKQRRVGKALETYRTYMPFDSDIEKHNWNLCLLYLTDYPKYQAEFQKEMNTILGDSGHPYFSRATELKQKMADKGLWK